MTRTPTCYVTGSAYATLVAWEPGRAGAYPAPHGPDVDRSAARAVDRLLAAHPAAGRRWRVAAQLHCVAPLLRRLRRLGAEVELAAPSLVTVGLVVAGDGGGVAPALRWMADGGDAIAASAGGPRPMDDPADLLVEMALRMHSGRDAELAALVRRHPVWPALSFFRGIRPAGLARLLAHAGDPGWLAHAASVQGDCPYDAFASACAEGVDDPARDYLVAPFRKLCRAFAGLALEDGRPRGGGPEWALLAPPARPEQLRRLAGLVQRAWSAMLAADDRTARELLAPEILLDDPGHRAAYRDHLLAADAG